MVDVYGTYGVEYALPMPIYLDPQKSYVLVLVCE